MFVWLNSFFRHYGLTKYRVIFFNPTRIIVSSARSLQVFHPHFLDSIFRIQRVSLSSVALQIKQLLIRLSMTSVFFWSAVVIISMWWDIVQIHIGDLGIVVVASLHCLKMIYLINAYSVLTSVTYHYDIWSLSYFIAMT